MGQTPIEWTDHSINPFRAIDRAYKAEEKPAIGHFCVKISPGCANCYSSRMQSRFRMPEFVVKNREKVELFLDEGKLLEVLRRKKPTKYFWCDMTDMFLDDYPDEWIHQCFATMSLTPWHTHQVLTKRADRLHRYISDAFTPLGIADWRVKLDSKNQREVAGYPFTNVWLGVSVEDQKTADERIPFLLKTPAAVRWVSYEPALGPVDFTRLKRPFGSDGRERGIFNALLNGTLDLRNSPSIGWIVVGGESGPGARPFDVQWARDTIDQCRLAGIPVFVKQLGARPVDHGSTLRPVAVARSMANAKWIIRDKKGGDINEWPEDLIVREYPEA